MLPWQAIGDCGRCRVEGATVELIDPGHPSFLYGRALLTNCKLCQRTEDYIGLEGRCSSCGEAIDDRARDLHGCGACGHVPDPDVVEGIDLSDPEAIRLALKSWAADEGMSPAELCEHSLGLTEDELIARLARGEKIESSLHAIAFLFPGMAAGGSADEAVFTAPREPPPAPEPVEPDPMAPARLLVSVMLADGAMLAAERKFLDGFLATHGIPGLSDDDLRPWRPHEVGPIATPELAEATIEAAVELMHLDGSFDGSELRIIRTFARVWGVSEQKLAGWTRKYERRYAPPLSTLWAALSRWVS